MLGVVLIAAFVIGSVSSLVLVEMLFNDGWMFAFKTLAVVELALVPLLLYRYRRALLDFSYFRSWLTIFLLCSASGGFLLVGAPYIFLVNAVTSSGERVLFAGPVVSKWVSQGKGKSYIVQIADRNIATPVNILTSNQEYHSVSVGGQFSRCMSVGGLSIPYAWRYGLKPSCKEQ